MCLSPLRWSGQWTSRHALCEAWAADGHDVLFVDPPDRVGERAAAESRPTPDRLRLHRPPPRAPYGFLARSRVALDLVLAMNAEVYARSVVRAAVDRFGRGTSVTLVNSFMPVLGYRVFRRLRPAAHLYHRADELRSFPTFEARYAVLENEVIDTADAVVCVTDAVRAGIAGRYPQAVVLPNGVDPGRFADVVPDAEVAALPGPVAVLVGAVDHRVDVTLLQAVAAWTRARQGSFVVAGPWRGVDAPDGTVALGEVPFERVPAILAAATVATVCYRRETPGDALKLYEYLAAGLPVVTGRFDGLASVEASVAVVETPDAMADALDAACAERGVEADAARRRAIEGHRWVDRARAMLDLVAA